MKHFTSFLILILFCSCFHKNKPQAEKRPSMVSNIQFIGFNHSEPGIYFEYKGRWIADKEWNSFADKANDYIINQIKGKVIAGIIGKDGIFFKTADSTYSLNFLLDSLKGEPPHYLYDVDDDSEDDIDTAGITPLPVTVPPKLVCCDTSYVYKKGDFGKVLNSKTR